MTLQLQLSFGSIATIASINSTGICILAVDCMHV